MSYVTLKADDFDDVTEERALAHYGILHKSGRYPWGSGGTVEQRSRDFLSTIESFRRKGMTPVQIAKAFSTEDYPFTTTDLRAATSIANNAKKQADIAQAQKLKDKGMSNVAIGQKMGLNESSVRALLAPGQQEKTDILTSTADMLEEQVAKKKYVDIGAGVALQLGISNEKLAVAVAALKEKGYTVHSIQVDQNIGKNQKTTVKVLAPPGTKYLDVKKNSDQIQQISGYSKDGGRSYDDIQFPTSIDSKRVAVRYAEQGGTDADGVIYVRPGVKDVSLGSSRYAQVRVAVDGTHFLKGMAVYKDDLPEGVDLMFNTNKSDTGNKLDAMKPLKRNKETGEVDKDLPFGAMISRQITEVQPDGSKKLTSVMNIVNDEGDWEKWSKNLPSQFLSKQNKALIKQQLDVTYERRKNELDEILNLNNPVVREKLLKSYSDSADAAAVHLKAAALPKQKTHVILPLTSIKETEIYAPNYENGTRVALVRFPHGGIFEIPELTVNNRNAEGKKLLGNAENAVGIHSKVAQHLSGADFDGDTVLVIPNNHRQVKSAPPLEGLKGFDPQKLYKGYEGMEPMTPKQKGQQMGYISNLITDMTIKGASDDKLARAVRHSMVVIDAEKHNLDWKRSAKDNGIAALMKEYQGKSSGGASTLISKSGRNSTVRIPEVRERKASEGGFIDKATGKKVYVPTGASYQRTIVSPKTGIARTKTIINTTEVQRLANVENAHELSSGTVVEALYADHSNRLKDLANKARKEMVNTKHNQVSSSARRVYAKEVADLNAKLNLALRNAPLERQARIIADSIVSKKKAADPDMDKAELKKIQSRALNEARIRTGAHKTKIHITDSEWDAIQAGAISTNQLSKIIDNADLDRVKELATPKSKVLMTPVKTARAQQMLANGFTQAEVAKQLGVSVSTLKNSLK